MKLDKVPTLDMLPSIGNLFGTVANLRGGLLLDQAATTIRRYFVGLTVLGVFNATVVVIAALVLDVPLVATIAVITLLGSYVPYIGALILGRLHGADRVGRGWHVDGNSPARL